MEGGGAGLGQGPVCMPWPSWIEVDLDAIRHNVIMFRGLLDADCQIMAVVKAQAYGHGAVPVARAALEAGATWLAVARAGEGVELRNAGIETPILLLGPFTESEVPLLVRHKLRPTLVGPEQAQAVSDAAVAAGSIVPVHLKLDTGLGRYGASLDEVRSLLHRLKLLPGIRLEALYSHFATADEPDPSYALSQLQAFHEARAQLEGEGFHFSCLHMAASAATLGVDGSHLNMVRIGLSLYGLCPSPHLGSRAPLRPALSLHSRVARLFSLEEGQSVGYGRTFVAEGKRRAALIPVGYADGLPRSHSNRGAALISGVRAPLIGRVSMDQCVADVTECGPVAVGDPVVFIGSQGAESINCDEFAMRSGTISYEVLTTLGHRVPRVYVGGGRIQGVVHLGEGRLEGWTP